MFMVILKYTADTEKKYLISFSLPLFLGGGEGRRVGKGKGHTAPWRTEELKSRVKLQNCGQKKKG